MSRCGDHIQAFKPVKHDFHPLADEYETGKNRRRRGRLIPNPKLKWPPPFPEGMRFKPLSGHTETALKKLVKRLKS
jgi:hypothetical protein